MSISWAANEAALVAVQQQLASARPEPWQPLHGARVVAGCFVCFQRGRVGAGTADDEGWAAAALLVDGERAHVAVVTGRAPAPYVSGLLALRDGPLLEDAIRQLPAPPEVVLVNATGRDHPRHAGLALHLGARLDIPTIGALSLLRIDDEVVACWLRLRRGVRPLVIHPGWRTDLGAAVAVVMATTTRDARTPEPLREARRAAREARAAKCRLP
jgi:deoxyribonuclease V